ncbi:MAG TPA: DUF992 domain-containing protein [Xanthobacteraceae bacterium]|nr:DUF992 domain-containing protein [Xanthobacteraceae bacterium]
MIRTSFTRMLLAAGLAAGTAAVAATPAAAQARRTEVGMLECKGSASVSFIIGSRRTLTCQFKSTRGVSYPYEGTINRWGLDIGFTARNVLLWTVFAPTRAIDGRKDLTGNYAGVSGSVAVGLGVAGNALVGGSNRTIALQPFSIEGQTGVNLAVGVGDLRLRAR